jgi:hypothetical protein
LREEIISYNHLGNYTMPEKCFKSMTENFKINTYGKWLTYKGNYIIQMMGDDNSPYGGLGD